MEVGLRCLVRSLLRYVLGHVLNRVFSNGFRGLVNRKGLLALLLVWDVETEQRGYQNMQIGARRSLGWEVLLLTSMSVFGSAWVRERGDGCILLLKMINRMLVQWMHTVVFGPGPEEDVHAGYALLLLMSYNQGTNLVCFLALNTTRLCLEVCSSLASNHQESVQGPTTLTTRPWLLIRTLRPKLNSVG